MSFYVRPSKNIAAAQDELDEMAQTLRSALWNKDGEKWHGAQVVSPEDFDNLRQEYCSSGEWPIVVASTIHQDAVARRIGEELKWDNPLVLLSS